MLLGGRLILQEAWRAETVLRRLISGCPGEVGVSGLGI